MNPTYPIYVPTKGRADSRLTIRALTRRNIPFRVVVEPQEVDTYLTPFPRKHGNLDPSQLLVLPWSNRPDGLVAARNWIRAHAEAEGHAWHWQLDDNIRGFYRLHQNIEWRTTDGAPFYAIEQWASRYENVAIAGMQYELLAPRHHRQPPP